MADRDPRTVDDRDLTGFDPYDAFDREAERLRRFFTSIDADTWSRASRCAGWTVRDVLGHLRSGEDYFQACIDGRVADLLAQYGARGATGLDSANALGVADHAEKPAAALIDEWWALDTDTRTRIRGLDGGDMDTSVGAYPARWQAFHFAQELATHADDVGVPVEAGEEPARTRWRAAVSRFALREVRPDVRLEARDGATWYRAGELEGTVTDRDLVELVAAREPRDDRAIAPEVREALRAMP
jgi:uncharacterized protein (TIGR03083 family)